MEENKLFRMSKDIKYRRAIQDTFCDKSNPNKYMMSGINFKPATQLIIYHKLKDGGYECCDGKVLFNIPKMDITITKDFKKDTIYSYCHYCRKEQVHTDLFECHKRFLKDSHKIEYLTNDLIHPMRLGCPTEIARYLFCMSNYDKVFKPVDTELEYMLLEDTTKGALIWCKQGFKGDITAYDINSFYPFIMNSSFQFPFKEGQYKTITKLDKKLKYGIYKCKITNFDYRVFRKNELNLYTHVDIKWARKQGYTIELIEEDNNFYHYDDDCLYTGKEIFGEFVEYMYELKKKGKADKDCEKFGLVYALIKAVLTSLWGSLTQSHEMTSTVKLSEDFILSDKKILSMSINMEKMTKTITYIDKQYGYKGMMPRIKPFLLAQSRYIMSNLIIDDIDDIVRVQTDGFYTTNMNKDYYDCNDELGGLKLEYARYAHIMNVNSIVDEYGVHFVGKKHTK